MLSDFSCNFWLISWLWLYWLLNPPDFSPQKSNVGGAQQPGHWSLVASCTTLLYWKQPTTNHSSATTAKHLNLWLEYQTANHSTPGVFNSGIRPLRCGTMLGKLTWCWDVVAMSIWLWISQYQFHGVGTELPLRTAPHTSICMRRASFFKHT